MARKLGTAINTNLDNSKFTINSRLAFANNGDSDFYSGDGNTLKTIFSDAIPFLGSFLPGAYTVTTADLGAITYNNGTAGVGAFLLGAPGALNINGLLPAINSYVLVNAQSLAAQNGLYQVTNPGGPGIQWRLTRPSFYDGSANGKISFGNLIFVLYTLGLSANSAIYYLNSTAGSTPVIGTTSLNYVKVFDFANLVGDLGTSKNSNVSAQISVSNSSTGSNATAEFNGLTASGSLADAKLTLGESGGLIGTLGYDKSASKWVLCNTNTLGTGNIVDYDLSTLAAKFYGTVTCNNTGLQLLDTDASHTLGIIPGSNLTANRTLTLTTGDANRTIDMSGGSINVASGGTGATTLTANTLLQGNGTGAISASNSLTNDFTATSATSAQTRTITVTNTSNTASSQARYVATVAGATAGDAFQSFIVTGGTTWSHGNDNSDTDAYVIAASATLGTTNVFRSSAGGEITMPLQPAFYATLSATATNVTGNAVTYTLICNTEASDRNADYNNATGVFTAPVTGYYQFGLLVTFTGLQAANTSCSIELVTTSRTLQLFTGSIGAIRDGAGNLAYPFPIPVVNMTSSDTAFVRIRIDGGTQTVSVGGGGNLTCFSGVLLS